MCNDQSSILSCQLSAAPAEVRRSRGLRAKEPCLFDGACSSQPKNERDPLPPREVNLAAAGSCPACGHDGVGDVGHWWRLRWRVTCCGAGMMLTLGRGMRDCRRMGTGMSGKAGKVPGRSSSDLLYPGWGGGGQPKAALFSL